MIFFYGLVGAVVFFDQATKFFALRWLSSEVSVPMVPRVLNFTLVKNPGVAFGLFSDFAPLLFTVITCSLFLLFIIANRSHHEASLGNRWALSLILGGAVGNWIDRLRFAAVIDFIDFHVWPVFNIADSAITIGVCIFVWKLLTAEKSA